MDNFIVTIDDQGLRLDVFLSKEINNYSRAYIQKIIHDRVFVNNKNVKSNYRVKSNDLVTINEIISLNCLSDIKIPIIYEDDNCLVIDKPSGVLSHSKGKINDEATVESFISNKVSGFAGQRAGIVHRLDRGTSGVMICAKNPEAYKWLQKQFSSRKVKKQYVAVIKGHMPEAEAIIDMPIGRNPKSPASFRVNSNGKVAITAYRTEIISKNYALIKLFPKTGRTHQLRVHLSHFGHPIVGDTLYKGNVADRLYLHAETIEIKLPDLKTRIFEIRTPPAFKKIIKSDV